MRFHVLTLTVFLCAAAGAQAAGFYELNNPGTMLIGTMKEYTIRNRETLIELAREYDVGYNEIVAANRNIDPWVPAAGTKIVIPASWLLPDVLENGIIINIAEMRLYFFIKIDAHHYAATFPVGIGRQGFTTPAGSFAVTARITDPVWTVPEDIRQESPELPSIVPPGPHNPLGKYWLQLSADGYGIHGTNRPYGIGRRVSHGCIRLYPEDIKTLHDLTTIGTPVKIIHEPVKIAQYRDNIYMEVHRADTDTSELLNNAVIQLGRKRLLGHVDTLLLINAVTHANGFPAIISK